MDTDAVASLLLSVAGAIPALAALYLLVLAIASFHRRSPPPAGMARSRIVVVIPAYNEAALLPRCLASLRTQRYPRELFKIVVIADNCDDATPAVAREAGAVVMVRREPGLRGKGQALRWAFDRILAASDPVDAIVVVDADSIADPALLLELEAAMRRGADAVQADYVGLDDGPGSAAALRQAAFLLFHRTRFGGRAALGMPCALVGNGMLLRRSTLERVPWNAFSAVEDLEYSIDLRLAGVRPVFAPAALVAGPVAGLGSAAATQRMRWEGGRLHVSRTRLPRLVAAMIAHRQWSLLDAAVDLAIPPLGVLALVIIAGGGVSLTLDVLAAVSPAAVGVWAAALVMLTAYVAIGLRSAEAPASAYRALLRAPIFLVAKLSTYRRMRHGLSADRWERTQRRDTPDHREPLPTAVNADPGGKAPGATAAIVHGPRVEIGRIPVDVVDESEAVQRILGAVGAGRLHQVCTINLQFLVTAQRKAATRRVLQEAELNVADGAPVVWLSRVLGRPLPGRVAGADLVPALLRGAAEAGVRLFLLGGSDGVAQELAARAVKEYPNLIITGTLEPPVAPLHELADDEILEGIRGAGADILLVAFGHPKQDLWIAANRDRLPVSVAMGVGGTFDILTGRFRRAPVWAGRMGLEWLYRLLQEPRRLAMRYAACAAWLVGVLLPASLWQRMVGGKLTPSRSISGERSAG